MCDKTMIYNKIKYIIENIPDNKDNDIMLEKFKSELNNLCYRHPNELNNMNSCPGERITHLVNKYFPETENMPEWHVAIRKSIQ